MSQNNRNAARERKGGAPKRYDVESERRFTPSRQEERGRGDTSRISAERMSLRSERENDLYERQSM